MALPKFIISTFKIIVAVTLVSKRDRQAMTFFDWACKIHRHLSPSFLGPYKNATTRSATRCIVTKHQNPRITADPGGSLLCKRRLLRLVCRVVLDLLAFIDRVDLVHPLNRITPGETAHIDRVDLVHPLNRITLGETAHRGRG